MCSLVRGSRSNDIQSRFEPWLLCICAEYKHISLSIFQKYFLCFAFAFLWTCWLLSDYLRPHLGRLLTITCLAVFGYEMSGLPSWTFFHFFHAMDPPLAIFVLSQQMSPYFIDQPGNIKGMMIPLLFVLFACQASPKPQVGFWSLLEFLLNIF